MSLLIKISFHMKVKRKNHLSEVPAASPFFPLSEGDEWGGAMLTMRDPNVLLSGGGIRFELKLLYL
jgi:hypothetical protein